MTTPPSPQTIELFSKGLGLHQVGQLEGAEKYYRDALIQCPSFFDALHLLGVLLAQKGQLEAALILMDQALAASPRHEGVLTNRGLALHQLGRYESALSDFECALDISSDNALNYYNRGNTLQELKQYQAALQSYDKAIALDPQNAEIFNNRGNTLQELKQYQAALQSYDKAIALDPRNANAHYNRGNTLQELKQYQAALQSYDKAIALDPQNAEAFNGRGDCLYELCNIKAAKQQYQTAVQLNPNLIQARLGIPTANIPKVFSSGDDRELLRKTLSRDLDDLVAWSSSNHTNISYQSVGCHQPYYLAYQNVSNVEILQQYGKIAQNFMRSFKSGSLEKMTRTGAIQIGIISSHIHSHSVWNAITKGFVENFDKERFDFHFFHLGNYEDQATGIARALSKSFTNGPLGLLEWVGKIQNRQMDVLIYPEIGMHQLTTQLATMRLAPLQLAFWGHPETTGLNTIDYYVSGECLEADGSQKYYSEKLLKLSNLGCYSLPYSGPISRPHLRSLGIDEYRPILLCPGSPFKYQPQYDHVFIEIAQANPNCQFVFFDFPNTPTHILNNRLRDQFKKANLAFDKQVIVLPLLKPDAFYGLLKKADVFMDTIGFSGFNTALQAIECHLPIVTIEGQFMRGRLASGILKRLGILELIANDEEEYVSLVNKLLTDRPYNRNIRDQITSAQEILFRDLTPIKEFQNFLIKQCRTQQHYA